AAIGQNAMLWRTSPIPTELESVVVGWLRDALGLPDGVDGLLTDTASARSRGAADRHALDEFVGGACRRPGGGRGGRGSAGDRWSAGPAAAAGLRLGRGPFLARQSAHYCVREN